MAWREIIYQYDGSFEGLLCCVFESYTKKERPTAILRDGDDEPSLFEIRAVTTDRAHAQRIYRSLYKRSPRAMWCAARRSRAMSSRSVRA